MSPETLLYVNGEHKPKVAHEDDGAIDLVYNGVNKFVLNPSTVYKIHTGIFMEIPKGKCGIVFERSGMGAKGCTIHGRIIDSGYRGEIIVLLSKNCEMVVDTATDIIDSYDRILPKLTGKVEINPGDRIAQIVIVDKHTAMKFVDSLDQFSKTERGTSGLGSTGK